MALQSEQKHVERSDLMYTVYLQSPYHQTMMMVKYLFVVYMCLAFFAFTFDMFIGYSIFKACFSVSLHGICFGIILHCCVFVGMTYVLLRQVPEQMPCQQCLKCLRLCCAKNRLNKYAKTCHANKMLYINKLQTC